MPWLVTPLVEFENKIKASVKKCSLQKNNVLFLHPIHFLLLKKYVACFAFKQYSL